MFLRVSPGHWSRLLHPGRVIPPGSVACRHFAGHVLRFGAACHRALINGCFHRPCRLAVCPFGLASALAGVDLVQLRRVFWRCLSRTRYARARRCASFLPLVGCFGVKPFKRAWLRFLGWWLPTYHQCRFGPSWAHPIGFLAYCRVRGLPALAGSPRFGGFPSWLRRAGWSTLYSLYYRVLCDTFQGKRKLAVSLFWSSLYRVHSGFPIRARVRVRASARYSRPLARLGVGCSRALFCSLSFSLSMCSASSTVRCSCSFRLKMLF